MVQAALVSTAEPLSCDKDRRATETPDSAPAPESRTLKSWGFKVYAAVHRHQTAVGVMGTLGPPGPAASQRRVLFRFQMRLSSAGWWDAARRRMTKSSGGAEVLACR
jgi:hypothetical protein